MGSDPLQFFDQRRPLDTEQVGGFVAVPLSSIEGSMDEIALDRREIPGQVEPFVGKIDKRQGIRLGNALNFRRQVRHRNLLAAGAERHGAFHGILELPDVARPVIRHQRPHRTL